MINVLVTGVGSTLGYGILKCLRASPLDCRVVGTDYFDTAVGLYWVDQGFLLPDILDPGTDESLWLEKIEEIVTRGSIDVVLVGLDFEVPIFARHRERLESNTGCKVIVSPERVVDICFDKWNTFEFLTQNGLNAPASCLAEGVGAFAATTPFPWIVKPRTGSTSKNLFKVAGDGELELALANCPDPVIQECIGDDDEEFTCGTLFVGDRVISHVSLRRTLRLGNTAVAFSDDFPEVDRAIIEVTEKLQPFGPINLQLRLTAAGPTVFEINPRFSGTTPLRAGFGVNEVDILLRRVVLGEEPEPRRPKHGVIIRYTDEHFVSAEEFGKAERL